MAYKTFVAGEEALAADVNAYLMGQTVARFSSASARTSGLSAPVLNQLSMLDTAPGITDYWNGTAWVPVFGATRELSFTQITATKTVAQTAEAAADAVISAPTIAFDGATPIIIEFFSPAVVTASASGASVTSFLYQDGVSIGHMGLLQNPPAPGILATPLLMTRRMTPTAGNHTYVWAAISGVGSGQVQAGAGGVGNRMPAHLRITRA